jgi:hypothetical protein
MAEATVLPATPRELACARCGTTFACRPGGGCWCAEEAFRLPVPEAGGDDCLCPACLRALAARRNAAEGEPQEGSR